MYISLKDCKHLYIYLKIYSKYRNNIYFILFTLYVILYIILYINNIFQVYIYILMTYTLEY